MSLVLEASEDRELSKCHPPAFRARTSTPPSMAVASTVASLSMWASRRSCVAPPKTAATSACVKCWDRSLISLDDLEKANAIFTHIQAETKKVRTALEAQLAGR